jgi:hypothetical protein
VPSADYLHPFGFNQAFAVWNKNRRPFRIFDFHCQGLNSAGSIPSMIHRITINEASQHTTNKRFVLFHFDMDYKLCEFKGVLCEAVDTILPNMYGDAYEFKYITER